MPIPRPHEGALEEHRGFTIAWRTLDIQRPRTLVLRCLVVAGQLPGYNIQNLLLLVAPAQGLFFRPVDRIPMLSPTLELMFAGACLQVGREENCLC